MGGHSKKSGCGGGGGGGGGRANAHGSKRLRKDPGVPDLKDVARKLTATAQRKSHSIFSLRESAAGDAAVRQSGGALGKGAAGQGVSRLLSRAAAGSGATQGTASASLSTAATAPLTEEERQAAQRGEMAALALRTAERVHDYEGPLQMDLHGSGTGAALDDAGGDMMVEDVDRRGTDKSLRRFFKEFNRVVESCDVLLQVLDARDPLGCRLTKLEQNIRSSYGDEKKKIVIVLNKVDMLPSKEVVDAWIHYFEAQEHLMCIPFAATAKGSAGQSYVHNMFRRLRALARGTDGSSDRKAIVVGVIGYPNVGKSSIINALKRKNVVGVGNMPGFTTGNTEVELRSDVRVMDCPGVVMPGEDNGDVVLRGAVRVSELANPFTPVQRLLQRCAATSGDAVIAPAVESDENEEADHTAGRAAALPLHPLAQFYGIGAIQSDDVMEFIRQVGVRRGRLGKGGVVDEESTARSILDDWSSGRIAYYTYPPASDAFFSRADFRGGRATTSGRRDDDDDEDEGTAPAFVSSVAGGITLDGLPTFHLSMSRMADGSGSHKKWAKSYRDSTAFAAEPSDEDEDQML